MKEIQTINLNSDDLKDKVSKMIHYYSALGKQPVDPILLEAQYKAIDKEISGNIIEDAYEIYVGTEEFWVGGEVYKDAQTKMTNALVQSIMENNKEMAKILRMSLNEYKKDKVNSKLSLMDFFKMQIAYRQEKAAIKERKTIIANSEELVNGIIKLSEKNSEALLARSLRNIVEKKNEFAKEENKLDLKEEIKNFCENGYESFKKRTEWNDEERAAFMKKEGLPYQTR